MVLSDGLVPSGVMGWVQVVWSDWLGPSGLVWGLSPSGLV